MTYAGFWGAAGALLLMPAARGEAAGVAATALALGAAGLARGGFSVNHMDIAPQYAGVVMGISNTAGTLAGAAQGIFPCLVAHAMHVPVTCVSIAISWMLKQPVAMTYYERNKVLPSSCMCSSAWAAR